MLPWERHRTPQDRSSGRRNLKRRRTSRGARETDPEESEVERPKDAEEEEFSEPIRTPEETEAVSLEARETTTPGARHGPGGS
ncbi:hypothetical protein NDU88_006098 [Pleurodeles waltl]|uniref:Uncharacterized protein n=1 Tax=Pleurodeles waltl TaxID=8319 RepID=A0AAV7MY80_PLEWA|nr:hypothetical protein NDU88_006098 [Pleurodeles waltl]